MTKENMIYDDADIRPALLRVELNNLKKLKVGKQLPEIYHAKIAKEYFLNTHEIGGYSFLN